MYEYLFIRIFNVEYLNMQIQICAVIKVATFLNLLYQFVNICLLLNWFRFVNSENETIMKVNTKSADKQKYKKSPFFNLSRPSGNSLKKMAVF